MKLSDSTAIVTGGGSGIGRGSGLALAAEGARVAVFDRDRAGAERTCADITAAGGKAIATVGDVTDEAAVVRSVAEAGERLGPVRVLVNAAGIAVRKSLLDTSGEEWRRVLDVNLNGYFYFLKAAVPAMEEAGGGSIVQIASIAGHVGYGYPSYTAAKGGVLAITRQLASELAPKRIRINSISPGVIETGLNRDTLGNEAIRAGTIRNIPWGRLGDPGDIAKAVLFLAGPDSEFVTGSDLVVDGGMISCIHWGDVAQSLRSFHAASD
ncbi:MAG: glucose 1-dehydrogenase [Streptosporangiales bacterium]|nr:glucose 1-dehydrogenase [Streptosporangiales bacterium]